MHLGRDLTQTWMSGFYLSMYTISWKQYVHRESRCALFFFSWPRSRIAVHCIALQRRGLDYARSVSDPGFRRPIDCVQ